jgi:hypothetical protein
VKLLAALVGDRILDNGDGTFDVTRGGINEIYADRYPALVRFAYLIRLELDPSEAEALHRWRLDISHEGRLIGPPLISPIVAKAIIPNQPLYLNLLSQAQFPVGGPGEIVLSAWIDEDLAVPLVKLFVKTIPIARARP